MGWANRQPASGVAYLVRHLRRCRGRPARWLDRAAKQPRAVRARLQPCAQNGLPSVDLYEANICRRPSPANYELDTDHCRNTNIGQKPTAALLLVGSIQAYSTWTASRQRQSLEGLAHGASRGVGERGDCEIASTSQCAALTRCLGKNSCWGDSPRRCRKRSGKRTPGMLLAAVATVCPRKAVGLKEIAGRTGG